MQMQTQITIENLTKKFKTSKGTITALDNISLEIFKGQTLIIGGQNGSGKSLLVSILAGLEKASSGSIKIADKAGLGLVFQEAESQILGESPAEDIAFGPKNLGWKKEEISAAVKDALEKTGLTEKADFPARFLSGGEKRRLAIACMLAMELPVLILDEPYANLDYSGIKSLNALIRQLKKEGHTIIILTHEIEKCLGLADRFIVLFKGKKVFDGSPDQGLKQPLEEWNIRNPLVSYKAVEDLVWE